MKQNLQETASAQHQLIVTDGVFSMDGTLANLPDICKLAQQYKAMVMVDDSHGIGVLGSGGQGTPHHYNLASDIDIVSGTLGKALGGAAGGFLSGKRPLIDWLRQTCRPYLFSNSLAPHITATSLFILELLDDIGEQLRKQLFDNLTFFTEELKNIGFTFKSHNHPIIPILIEQDELAKKMSELLFQQGVLAINFSHPVVPKGQSRIRVQLSSAHKQEHLLIALEAFERSGKKLGII